MQTENMNEKLGALLKRKDYISSAEFAILVFLGIIGIALWVFLFSFGLLINSEVYRTGVLTQFNWGDFIMSVLTYTPTNIAMLSVISAFAGGCASRMLIASVAKKTGLEIHNQEMEKTDSQLYMAENPFGSMLRGLVVYFGYLAGVFIANSAPFTNTTPEQYAQSAGIVSLFAFVVGFDPTVFRSFISVSGRMKQNPKQT
jgi:hypothetical protein